ncbi:vesicle transport protein USE1 [Neocloeon triangulifer]|uniref:vesicle transport protein USE1 n=1 Tax=Neocloeon triangulifer TaxID=2078957 RepID=UPI00286EE085|nr:vesicle transport protein USE1 [Neocloeon triangulifer]XP_059479708.1 vesicle transport protein USE1 [Neocloeon triangulifer]XP_059479709.1 vesicle transport protein USE1 [Neocloeon triangulifer]XP_059479711.1 vesicle transport protein USE1 [Neocloeon triangulifer]
MSITRLEINFRRLLSQCEQLAKDDDTKSSWRLDKYISALEDMFADLEKHPAKASEEQMGEYSKRVKFLKNLRMADQLPTVPEKLAAAQMVSHTSSLNGADITTEIQQKTKVKYTTELKEQLFQTDKGNGLRQRSSRKSSTGDDVDALLKYHHSMQEKIAEDMLSMTKNLKEQTILANSIIKKDIKVTEQSQNLSELNAARLKVESEKLQEHSKRACKCWLWLMIIVVISVFISMVLFMKLMKKKSY